MSVGANWQSDAMSDNDYIDYNDYNDDNDYNGYNDYNDYNNYNGYRDSDLDLNLDWQRFSELLT